jgi:hypothetical protein
MIIIEAFSFLFEVGFFLGDRRNTLNLFLTHYPSSFGGVNQPKFHTKKNIN